MPTESRSSGWGGYRDGAGRHGLETLRFALGGQVLRTLGLPFDQAALVEGLLTHPLSEVEWIREYAKKHQIQPSELPAWLRGGRGGQRRLMRGGQQAGRLLAFRRHLRRVERAFERWGERWASEPWWRGVSAGRYEVELTVDQVRNSVLALTHRAWPPWERSERRPEEGVCLACPAMPTPHRHCGVCPAVSPDEDGASHVRPIALVHPLTWQRKHLGWRCAEHRLLEECTFPDEWIERMRTAGLGPRKRHGGIRVWFPNGGPCVDISGLLDAGRFSNPAIMTGETIRGVWPAGFEAWSTTWRL